MSALRAPLRPGAINAVSRLQRTSIQAIRSETNSAASALPLTWPEYLTLRHRRRVLAQIFSIPGALGGLVGGGAYFGSLEADPTQPIFGIEPMFVYAGATLGCMGLGYLAGPTVGSMLFKAMNGSRNKAIEVMDKRFYEHIKARRVDPSYQSVNTDMYGTLTEPYTRLLWCVVANNDLDGGQANPPANALSLCLVQPTGEKIKSLPTYRRWLRDQAAYRRKALHGMKEEEAL
ncbi:hypothetical protein QFC19_002634 [Naganishia cerealis]|uniref:Uncharacterized protein n=1 Tax=Naganishia cerealis TaxID=610337 RepID=A0ACC2WAK9_9TREE|nr:hypothetical protein QFC19_002634 [Naganishia cerealis]